MILTRFTPNIAIVKPLESADGLRRLYNHVWIYQQYRNYVRKKSGGPHHSMSPVFSNFQFFMEWYNINSFEYLMDPWGNLMVPHDPRYPQHLFPLQPTTLISSVEQHWLRLKPVGRGGQRLPYLYGRDIWQRPHEANRYFRLRGDLSVLVQSILQQQVYPFYRQKLFGEVQTFPTLEQICEEHNNGFKHS